MKKHKNIFLPLDFLSHANFCFNFNLRAYEKTPLEKYAYEKILLGELSLKFGFPIEL